MKTDNIKKKNKQPTLINGHKHFLFFQSLWALVPEPAWGGSHSPGTPAPMVPTLILNLCAIFTHSLTDQIFKWIFNSISSIKHTVHFLLTSPFLPQTLSCITFCSISNSSGMVYTWMSGIQTEIFLLMLQALFLISVLKNWKILMSSFPFGNYELKCSAKITYFWHKLSDVYTIFLSLTSF